MATAPRPAPRRRTRRALSSVPLRYIRRLIEDNDPTAFAAIPREELTEDELVVYERIEGHYRRHRVFPSQETLLELGVPLPEAPEPLTFYRDQFFNSIRVRRAAEVVTEVQSALQANDGRAVEDILARFRIVAENPEIIFSTLGARADMFEGRLDPAESMVSRVSTGIPAVDDTLGGTKRCEVIFLAGRPGTGKTFTAIAAAMNLAEDGERVLFISKEMTSEAVEDRMYFMLMDLDPGINVRRFSTTHTREVVRSRRPDIPPAVSENIIFPNHDAILTTADVESAIRSSRPSICVIDGSYFIRALGITPRSEDRERLQALIREIREIALRCRVTMMLTWQQNRSKTFGTEGLYGTDAASQDAGLVLMLKKIRGFPELREMHIVKNRHGPDEFSVGMGYGFKPTTVGELATLPEQDASRERAPDTRRGRERHTQRAMAQAQAQGTGGRTPPPVADIPDA